MKIQTIEITNYKAFLGTHELKGYQKKKDVNAAIKIFNQVLNAFCHYNTERHEIKTELKKAIDVIKDLKTKTAH